MNANVHPREIFFSADTREFQQGMGATCGGCLKIEMNFLDAVKVTDLRCPCAVGNGECIARTVCRRAARDRPRNSCIAEVDDVAVRCRTVTADDIAPNRRTRHVDYIIVRSRTIAAHDGADRCVDKIDRVARCLGASFAADHGTRTRIFDCHPVARRRAARYIRKAAVNRSGNLSSAVHSDRVPIAVPLIRRRRARAAGIAAVDIRVRTRHSDGIVMRGVACP